MKPIRAWLPAFTVILLCSWPLLIFRMDHYLPEVDNDEVSYFLQVKTFLYHGLRGGYYFFNDRVPASPIHFDVHGPGIAIVYGSVARVIGWRNYSPYLANLLFLIPGWLLLQFATRHRPANQIAVSLFVLLHGYFFLFLPSMMEESFHISVAIMIVALWSLALDRRSGTAWVALWLVVAIAAVVRMTWGLTVPVLAFSMLRQRYGTADLFTTKNSMLAAAASAFGVVCTLAAVALWRSWALPPLSIGGGETMLRFNATAAWPNFVAFLTLRSLTVFHSWDVYFRVSLWILLMGFVVLVVRGRPANREAAAYSLGLLAPPVAAQILFYVIDGWRDFRVLSAYHALAGLWFLARAELPAWGGSRPIIRYAGAVAAGLLIVFNFGWAFLGMKERYYNNWSRRAVSRDAYGRVLFRSIGSGLQIRDGDDAFCKTIYVWQRTFNDERFVHLPLGFGVSALQETEDRALPALKGKYVLIGSEYVNTRSGLMAMGINPDDHSAISGAELAGRIQQGRRSGWADDDPANPIPDWKGMVKASKDWRLEEEQDEYTLFRSTTHCLDGP
jgi:hypothetical protein